jgi:hypothetical protein
MRKTIAPCKNSNNTNAQKATTPCEKNNNRRRKTPLM